MDGFALANFLREQGAKMPVIAMTAHATDDDYRRCEQVGAAEVVLKPLSISALDAALRRQTVRGWAPAPARAVADGGAPAMSDSVRDALRDATLRSLAVIGNALASGDLQAIKVELHSTRGGFALAGDIAARDACAYAERAVTEGGAEAMRPARPGLEAAIGEALERLARRQ
ncbi:hypothetical protein WL30_00280 [Burkholderia ubonensis]|nr:hypothetical protein WL30_00280 [Burkholderia ubonensis]KWB28120.1 hypothetical protein WL31_30220 [Burkholderia ubonensis]